MENLSNQMVAECSIDELDGSTDITELLINIISNYSYELNQILCDETCNNFHFNQKRFIPNERILRLAFNLMPLR